MNDPLHANLRYVTVIKNRVGYAGDAKQKQARGHKQKGAQIGLLRRFGYRGMKGDKGGVLRGSASTLGVFKSEYTTAFSIAARAFFEPSIKT